MKQVLTIFVLNLVPLSCIAVSAYMAIHGLGNWGWFFALAVIATHGATKVEK